MIEQLKKDFSQLKNEYLIKELEYSLKQDIKSKVLIEEVAKRLLEQEKKDELLAIYRELFDMSIFNYFIDLGTEIQALEEELK